MFRVLKQLQYDYPAQRQGDEAASVSIGILDTGVNAGHPDLSGRIRAFRDFTGNREGPYDDCGHGTHVCGIVAGSGALSGGKYRGIAPGAGLVVGKILDYRGDGTVEDMLRGIDWMIQIRKKYAIRVLNISVGVGKLLESRKEELLQQKLEEAWDAGLAVVCAAGNNGPAMESISIIGRSPKVITVGCHDGDYCHSSNCCAAYSSRGSRFLRQRKPDIVAPGTEIVSCNGNFTRVFGNVHSAYTAKSGTSMAAPMVSGALAVLFMKYPHYDNERAKELLLRTAVDLHEPWYQQGWGMLNIGALLKKAAIDNF